MILREKVVTNGARMIEKMTNFENLQPRQMHALSHSKHGNFSINKQLNQKMKTITTTLIAVLVVFSLFGCKKDTEEKTTAQKIQGKWNITSVVSIEDVPPTPKATFTDEGIPGDYYDFRTDGMVYIKEQAYEDDLLLPYAIIDDTKITIDGAEYVIKQLTDKVLVLHHTHVFSTGGSTEDIVYLNR